MRSIGHLYQPTARTEVVIQSSYKLSVSLHVCPTPTRLHKWKGVRKPNLAKKSSQGLLLLLPKLLLLSLILLLY